MLTGLQGLYEFQKKMELYRNLYSTTPLTCIHLIGIGTNNFELGAH